MNSEQAQAIAIAILAQVPEVNDPDFSIIGAGELALVKGEYRSSVIVQPEDGIIPFSEAGLNLASQILIRLNHSDPPQALRSIKGISIGSWEGETLSIQTTHFRGDDPARENFGRVVLIGEGSRVMERFTPVSETELLYRYTVEDPAFYTEPWSGEFSFTRFDSNTYEYSCHEGNYSMAGILRGGQLEASRLAEAANDS